MTEAVPSLDKPFFAEQGVPCLDFNRELQPPGANEKFPDGAVGIRVDDDFWVVAVLPWSYAETPLPEIVKTFWPEHAGEAEYGPDSGTPEQELFFLKRQIVHLEEENEWLNRAYHAARNEGRKLKHGRPVLSQAPA